MNSKIGIKKLGVNTAHTSRVRENLLNDLIVYEHIQTTATRAKVVLRLFDHAVTIVKTHDLKHAERALVGYGVQANAFKKLTEVLKPRFEKVNNGFAAVFKIGNRKGDNAPMAQIFVKGYEYKELGKKKAKQVKKQEKVTKESGRQTKIAVEKNLQRDSQAAVSKVQGKAKSRSGV